MKIRNGFVSNSSSASFIVATKDEKMKLSLTIKADLSRFIEKKLKNVKEINKYFLEECTYEKDDDGYLKALKAVKSGKIVYIINVSDDTEDPIETFLCDNGIVKNTSFDKKDIEIIFGEGGY